MEERTRQVLIVDDNPHNIQVLAAVMEELGYDTGIAMSAKEAFDYLDETLPDIILLDIMMPEIDGLEACRIIKSKPGCNDIPIIFLTAKAEKEDIVAGFDAGGVDYITKPFNRAELKVRVKNHLELKQSRDDLKNLNGELIKLNATKDKLFSIIAHDLRNPIGATKSLSGLLVEDYYNFNDNERLEFLKTIEESSEGVFKLLEDLLAWSRSQRNLIDFHPETISLYQLVDSIISLLHIQAANKHIEIYNNISIDIFAYFDLNLISTVFRNLISNAIKFTKQNGVISLNISELNSQYWEISVADNGVGMSAEKASGIFKIEKTKSTLGTNDETGSGLGLVLCKEFIEKHNCQIRVESELGKGSTFFFTLPKSNVF